MHQRLRFLAAASVTVIAAGALGACGALDDKTFEDDHAVSEKITSIRLDNADGGVEVRGTESATKVSVHRKVDYRNAKPGSPTYRVENGVLVLAGCGHDCSVNYRVDVPANLPVTGSTTNGEVDLSAVGEVKVSTSNGDVTVDGATGPVDLRTSNGQVDAKGLKGGGVRAETSDGSVSISPAVAQDVWVKTSSGDVTVTAPTGPYRVSTHIRSGSRHISVPTDPSAEYALDLSASSGDITVKTA
jgi:Putative adhesin